MDEDLTNAFVYLTFDNSNLIDLTNLYPMLDSVGLKTKPTTWSIESKLENSLLTIESVYLSLTSGFFGLPWWLRW